MEGKVGLGFSSKTKLADQQLENHVTGVFGTKVVIFSIINFIIIFIIFSIIIFMIIIIILIIITILPIL